jgi:hypothetical protein
MKLLKHVSAGAALISAILCFSVGVLLLSRASAGQTLADNSVHLSDNSDWWSSNRIRDAGYNVKTQERVPSDANYEILGVNLSDDLFASAASRLGKAVLVERENDASNRRTQTCYSSADDSGKVHLVFEKGAFPIGSGFYLFKGGVSWTGHEMCLSSKLLTGTLSTGSGLRLGQSPSEVIAILGKPSRQMQNELIYSFHARRRRTTDQLRSLRQVYSALSEQEFNNKFEFYDLESGINAKFADQKLSYLAVSRVELN